MRKHRTIRLRLTLWGAGITLGVAILVSGLLYAGVSYSLHREIDSFLEGEIHEFMGVVRQHQGNIALAEQEIRTHLGSRSLIDLRFRVFNANRNLVLQSDPQDPVPVETISRAAQSSAPTVAHFETFRIDKPPARLRVCTMRLPEPEQGLIAQASYSMSNMEASLAMLRRGVAISLFVAAGLALIAGRVLASRSLAPLDQITSQASHITAQSLSDRLPRTGNGDEFDRLSAVLNELLDRVEAHVNRMQQFTADASHELRSPLAALRGSAEVALSRTRDIAQLRQVIEESVEHYDRLIRIAEDLLLLARLDSGQAILRKEEMDLTQAVDDVTDLFAPLATERGLNLTFQRPESTFVHADPGRIRQVIANLLDNAIKYTPAPGDIRVELTRDNGSVCVLVQDSGIGIAPTDQARVFDRFYRADRARSRGQRNGAGLGLAISRSIVEAHGGIITLTSDPSTGTSVMFRLQTTNVATESRESQTAAPGRHP